jgi:hypothetical protein
MNLSSGYWGRWRLALKDCKPITSGDIEIEEGGFVYMADDPAIRRGLMLLEENRLLRRANDTVVEFLPDRA